MYSKNNVPSEFQFLFPSSLVGDLDVNRDKIYIIETLLRNATLEAWQWMIKSFTSEDIKFVVQSSRNLRPKDVMIWIDYFDIPQREILCLQTKSRFGLKSSWVY